MYKAITYYLSFKLDVGNLMPIFTLSDGLIAEVEGNKLILRNEGDKEIPILELVAYYTYTVTEPDGREVIRKGKEKLAEGLTLRPGDSFEKSIELDISGFRVVYKVGENIIEREVEV